MTTYPLTFPAVGVESSTFRLVNVTDMSVSPFTGEEQVYAWPGQWWEGQVTFRATRREDAREIQAFVAKLRGMFGTFLYGDPDAIALGVQGAGGTILVNGANQTGNTLLVDGMTPSTTILQRGDYFQLGTGLNARYHMVTEPLVSSAGGTGTITFEPDLRESPADNASVVTSGARGLFRLAENNIGWESDKSSVYNVSLSFREAL